MSIATLADTDLSTAAHGAEVGLKGDEYERAVKILGRVPNKVELGCFSAMWSEHCSYKSSRVHLSKLPTKGERVLVGPGENAGVVDLGDDWAVCFKVESHNHPSYIEPYQGAATGVGGILRDIFTMGARPVAAANLLRFGRPEHKKTPHLVAGVVKGIGDYGNCFGVPTVWSDVDFDASYDGNILVNAFALGVLRHDGIFKGVAEGVGNPVLYVGAKTGRDGIHGATMASDSFSEEKEAQRPTVQVGDPFKEKLLLEACLDAFKSDLLVGIQDMGAAGLTSSSFEMASRAGSGLRLDLDKIPTREVGMTAYELLLSESQERMLLVAKKGKEAELAAIYARWELDCVPVGEVTDDGMVRLLFGGKEVGVLPARELADEAPKYERPFRRPEPKRESSLPSSQAPSLEGRPVAELIKELAAAPCFANRDWIYRQYDREVGAGTLLDGRRGAAAVVEILEANKTIAVAMTVDAWRCAADPREGARRAVAEAALRVACVGARPVGATDCLNYGNPENPDVMGQIVEGIEGMAEACLALEVPIVSGNVSLYNETDGKSIHPTPTVGVVGHVEVPGRPPGFEARLGDALVLVGGSSTTAAGSLMERLASGGPPQSAPPWELPLVHQLILGMLAANARGLLRATSPVLAGGLAGAALQMAFASDLGVKLFVEGDLLASLFGEDQPAVLVAVAPGDIGALRDLFPEDVDMISVGLVEGQALSVRHGDAVACELPLEALREGWRWTIPRIVASSRDPS
jgi:phosphoribosylformylglycinamidine synthase subunit PurL